MKSDEDVEGVERNTELSRTEAIITREVTGHVHTRHHHAIMRSPPALHRIEGPLQTLAVVDLVEAVCIQNNVQMYPSFDAANASCHQYIDLPLSILLSRCRPLRPFLPSSDGC